MKKILLIIFILFCGLIFYQIILGKNGLINGYQTQLEKKILLEYKLMHQKQNKELADYIEYLKNNPRALEELAHDLGFVKDGQHKLLKIKTKEQYNRTKDEKIDFFYKQYLTKQLEQEKIKKIRIMVSILFYLFFGFFVILIIFSGHKDG